MFTEVVYDDHHILRSFRFLYQKTRYDEIIYPEIEHIPPRFGISHRNKWMVEKADSVIAYVEHGWGGAYQTYQHAKRKKKEIWNLSEREI